MSTYLHLVCVCHDPPLVAPDESGQHLYDLPQIRADIAKRRALIDVWDGGDVDLGYFRNNTVRFLAQHEDCELRIKDEYGQWHPITEDK